MIPENFINQWRSQARWPSLDQVEQDLVISRALVELYSNEHVRESFAFRGGTALNKLFLNSAVRYSEDIDLVQKTIAPIGKTIDTIREILEPWLGIPKWKVTQRSAKLIYKYQAVNEKPAKLKIEINTTEHFQVLPFQMKVLNVDSEWFKGSANIVTYDINELMATKLKALYQRRKGRDLFDIWYVVQQGLVDLDQLISIFQKYCQNDEVIILNKEFVKNLELKKSNESFRLDMDFLLPRTKDWSFDKAYQFVLDEVISKLP